MTEQPASRLVGIGHATEVHAVHILDAVVPGQTFVDEIKDIDDYVDIFLSNEDTQKITKDLILGYEDDYLSNDDLLVFLSNLFLGPQFRLSHGIKKSKK